jgi:phage terminase small subunit
MPAHRKPTAVLEASGAFDHNPSRRRARANEPKPAGPVGDPPAWLQLREKKCWTELVEAAPAGVLAKSDGIALATACVLFASIKARKASAAQYNQFRQYLQQLGMTAASRSNVQVTPSPDDSEPDADL